jgi:predicted ATPase
MLIREITLRNLLSFGPETPPLELRPLNVLIGPNGSGKSNLIEAISLLQAAPKDLSTPIGEGGGIDEWIWKGAPKLSARIGVELQLPSSIKSIRHELRIVKRNSRCVIDHEKIDAFDRQGWDQSLYSDEGKMLPPEFAGQDARSAMLQFDDSQSVLAQLALYDLLATALGRSRGDLQDLIDLERAYARIRIYKDWSFGRRSPLRRFGRADQKGEVVSEDFENLGLVLNRLKHQPAVKRRILDALRDLYDGITDFDLSIFGGMFQLYLEEGDFSIPASRLSDGTLRYLGLLAILCHPEPPLLVCIEEPELGLHPDALLMIARLIEEASERTQLIITTHSQFLVDYFTHDPEAIVVCEKGERGTTMRRLKASELEVWLKEYSLGNLWSSGQIGGNRW